MEIEAVEQARPTDGQPTLADVQREVKRAWSAHMRRVVDCEEKLKRTELENEILHGALERIVDLWKGFAAAGQAPAVAAEVLDHVSSAPAVPKEQSDEPSTTTGDSSACSLPAA